MKPKINLDELELESDSSSDGVYQQRYGVISARIGAKKLGYNLTIVPPGASACSFHSHHNNEELFFIIEGRGLLRFGDQELPLRKHDVIACPPGAAAVAHQIINNSDEELRYLAVSTKERVDVAELPDTNELKVFVGDYGAMEIRETFKRG